MHEHRYLLAGWEGTSDGLVGLEGVLIDGKHIGRIGNPSALLDYRILHLIHYFRLYNFNSRITYLYLWNQTKGIHSPPSKTLSVSPAMESSPHNVSS